MHGVAWGILNIRHVFRSGWHVILRFFSPPGATPLLLVDKIYISFWTIKMGHEEEKRLPDTAGAQISFSSALKGDW